MAAGLHVVVHLPEGSDAAAVVAGAAERGVRVADLATYRAGAAQGAGLVLGYGNIDGAAVEEAVRALAAAVRHRPAGPPGP